MRFHQLRNATCVIESGDQVLLVNLMLGKKGSLQPFARFRHKPQPNPLVPLPEVADQLLDRVTACLLTLSQKMPDRKSAHSARWRLSALARIKVQWRAGQPCFTPPTRLVVPQEGEKKNFLVPYFFYQSYMQFNRTG